MNAAQKVLKRWAVLPEVEAAVKKAEVAAVRCKTLKTLDMKLTDIQYGIEEAQEMIYRLRGLEAVENVAQQTGEGVARIKLLHNLNIKLGLINEKATFCRADLESPRVAYLEQLAAAAVKNAENAATRAGELAIFKGRLNEIMGCCPGVPLVGTKLQGLKRLLESGDCNRTAGVLEAEIERQDRKNPRRLI